MDTTEEREEMNPLWLSDIIAWNKLPLTEQAEALRQHYCTGPCAQSSHVMTTRSVTDKFLRAVKEQQDAIGKLVEAASHAESLARWDKWKNSELANLQSALAPFRRETP